MNQFLQNCGKSITIGLIALAIGFILFSLLERLFSLLSLKKSWRANFIDVRYALLSMFYSPFIYFLLTIVFGLLSIRFNADAPSTLTPMRFAGQLLLFLFVRDCAIYVRHFIFHRRAIWKFHSIHHSSEDVNWLSAVRFHPVENLIESAGETLLFLVFTIYGCNPQVLFAAGGVMGFYNFFIHSNLRWTLGPLRYVFVSPVFHRWHHSDKAAAQDKNYAAMFSFIDLLLGTFYMPKNSMPTTTGLSTPEKSVYPRSFSGQILYPFKRH